MMTRPLHFPLNQPLRVGSQGAVEGTVTHTVPDFFPEDPDARIVVQMSLSFREYLMLASSIDVGRDLAYGAESENVWWIWVRALLGESQPPASEITRQATSSASSFLIDDNDEDNDEMACNKVVKINDAWYLQVDCGCANAQFFQLTPVSLGASGDPVSLGDGGQFDGGFGTGTGTGWYQTGITVSSVSCYADLAVEYLLQRAYEFAELVIDAGFLGVDYISEADEWLETARLIGDIIFGTGDITEIQSLSKSAVSAAFASEAVLNPLKAAWTFTGVPTRNELFQWAGAAPVLSSGVPVRFLLDQWIGFSLLLGYRDALAQAAATCESGNPIPGHNFPAFEWVWRFNFIDEQAGWAAQGTGATWTVGEGYGVNAFDWYILIYLASQTPNLSGVVLHLSDGLTSSYDIEIRNGNPTPVVGDATGAGDTEVSVAVDPATEMSGWVNIAILSPTQFALPAGMRLEMVDLYGSGETPSTGYQIA